MCYRGIVVEGHVECPKCGEENALDRTHCTECGEPLVPQCVIDALQKANPDIAPDDLRLDRR